MKHLSLSITFFLGLLTYLLYFVFDSFLFMSRSTSLSALVVLSGIALLFVLADSIKQARQGEMPVLIHYLCITLALLITTANGFVWLIGGVFA